jgi:hypothetical protein
MTMADLPPLQHLQPGGPGVFPTRRYEVTPYEGENLFWIFPGLKPWAQGYSPFGALQFGYFGDLGCGRGRIFGPTGHGNLAQGLPLETRSNASSPEWAIVLCRRSNMRSTCPDVPTGRLPIGKFTQGEPWAKLSCPFGAAPLGRGHLGIVESSNTSPGCHPNSLS